ncbi:hypothetical protein [Gelidibacter mesophilus]|uniref:hypothetical protein n=1 Tax=Gelidibacter mesophilus TaxID=169050 RepID=UPI0003FCCBA1|nr:hypothetical protein [Gelidibacter mesophilus]
MKKYNHLAALFLVSLLMMACDFGKNNSPDHSTTGRAVPENEDITNTTNYKNTGNFDAMDENSVGNDKVADSLNENWNLDNPKRKENLYLTFDMSQDQIQKYEAALRTWKESEHDDAFKVLSANEKIKEENRILKEILDDSQYERYKKWSNSNDLRN